MAMETGWFRGAGGSLFELPLPLAENYQHQVTRGQLVRVEPDGSDHQSTEPEPERTRPNVNSPKGEWVGWALFVDKDLTVDAADAMTKNDLIEKYGQK